MDTDQTKAIKAITALRQLYALELLTEEQNQSIHTKIMEKFGKYLQTIRADMSRKDKVYNYPTKFEHGFIQSEIDELLKSYPSIDMEKFNDALMGITCMQIDNQTIIYHTDILKAINCGVEKRGLREGELD